MMGKPLWSVRKQATEDCPRCVFLNDKKDVFHLERPNGRHEGLSGFEAFEDDFRVAFSSSSKHQDMTTELSTTNGADISVSPPRSCNERKALRGGGPFETVSIDR